MIIGSTARGHFRLYVVKMFANNRRFDGVLCVSASQKQKMFTTKARGELPICRCATYCTATTYVLYCCCRDVQFQCNCRGAKAVSDHRPLSIARAHCPPNTNGADKCDSWRCSGAYPLRLRKEIGHGRKDDAG